MTVLEYETRLNTAKSLDRVFFRPQDIAPLFECDPHAIRVMAAQNPSLLPFPFLRSGKRTKFLKVDVIQWAERQLDALKSV